MPPDLALLSTLISLNYPCLELIFMVSKVFEPMKFDCIYHIQSNKYKLCLKFIYVAMFTALKNLIIKFTVT